MDAARQARARCPVCSHLLKYPEDQQYGWCEHCGAYTAMCQAGREISFPGHLGGGNWQIPCLRPWTGWWDLQISRGGQLRARLCGTHGQAVAAGQAPVRGELAARRD
jgi:hypothetical protein